MNFYFLIEGVLVGISATLIAVFVVVWFVDRKPDETVAWRAEEKAFRDEIIDLHRESNSFLAMRNELSRELIMALREWHQ